MGYIVLYFVFLAITTMLTVQGCVCTMQPEEFINSLRPFDAYMRH